MDELCVYCLQITCNATNLRIQSFSVVDAALCFLVGLWDQRCSFAEFDRATTEAQQSVRLGHSSM